MHREIVLWLIGFIFFIHANIYASEHIPVRDGNLESTYVTKTNKSVSLSWLLYNHNDNGMNGIYQRAEHTVDAHIERYARESKCRYYCMGTAKEIMVSTKSNGPSKGVIIGEGLGGLVGGALGGAMVSLITYVPLAVYYKKKNPEWGFLEAAPVALSIGYLIAVPLCSTSGVSTVGNIHHQNGSIKGSMMGSAIGTIAGVGGVLIALGANTLTEKGDFWVDAIAVTGICVGLTITASGPTVGAVYGYNNWK